MALDKAVDSAILDGYFSDIADAIRISAGTQLTYTPAQMAQAIANIVNNQNKTVTPTESQQSVTKDSGYSGLGTVTVEAISSTYIGSDVPNGNILDYGLTDGTLPIVGVAKVGQAEL